MTDSSSIPFRHRIRSQATESIDSTVLVFVRIVVAVAIYMWAHSFLVEGKYDTIFLKTRFLFKYSGLEWIELWPGNGIYWHFVVTKIAAVGLAIGLLTRVSAALLCASIAYVLLVERQIYVNHYYLLACAAGLLVFLPAGRRYSVDAWLGIERAATTFSRWQFWLLRFQLGIPYVFGAVAKLNGDWFRGQPSELILRTRTNFPGWGPLSDLPGAVEVMAYGGFLYDLCVVPMLLCRRTRWLAVAMSLVFHLSNAMTLNIGVFPWFMMATLLVFFPVETLPGRLRMFLGKEQQPEENGGITNSTAAIQVAPTWIAKLGLGLAVVYVVIQLLLPLRPWIYPGDASWNEQGHLFSWRMMLRDKRALTTYLLVEPGRSFVYVPSTRLLSPHQSSHADHHPELIRQTAVQFQRYAAKELGVSDCEVYALALTTLNGRRPKPLVDPEVDLTTVQSGWWKDDWVAEDSGKFLDPPWIVDREQWWKELKLPAKFGALQGKTPTDLENALKEMARGL